MSNMSDMPSIPNVKSAVAKQVKAKMVLIATLEADNHNLELEKQANIKTIAERDATIYLLKEKIDQLENPPSCFCCGDCLDPVSRRGDWWQHPQTDAWYCPDCLDDRDEWIDDLNEEWLSCAGFKEEGPIQTYNMSGGHAGWWNVKLVFTTSTEYQLFIENVKGWEHKKGAKFWHRMGDMVLIEDEEDDHEHDYICNEEWDEKSSYEAENSSM